MTFVCMPNEQPAQTASCSHTSQRLGHSHTFLTNFALQGVSFQDVTDDIKGPLAVLALATSQDQSLRINVCCGTRTYLGLVPLVYLMLQQGTGCKCTHVCSGVPFGILSVCVVTTLSTTIRSDKHHGQFSNMWCLSNEDYITHQKCPRTSCWSRSYATVA